MTDAEDPPRRLRRLFVVVFTDTDEPVDGASVVLLDRHEIGPVRCWSDPDGCERVGDLRSEADGSCAVYVKQRRVRVVVRDDGRAVLGDWPEVRVSFREASYLVETDTEEPETVWVDWPPDR